MRKIVLLDEHFATGEQTVQPVLVVGRHQDTSRITKTASEALDYIKHVNPEPGKTNMLVLALGSEEAYGPNRNGDGFPERPVRSKTGNEAWIKSGELLTDHYKTFETNPAHAFKHHCFPAGTPVLMANRERRVIEDVEVGDEVVTLQGPRKVLNVMRRAYEGEGRVVHLQGEYEPLVSTADHPVQVFRREQIHCPHRYSRLATDFGCSYKDCKAQKGNIGDPEWAPASSLLPGDYMVLPRPVHGEENGDPNFARLVGWVASEGHLGARGSIQFCYSTENRVDIAATKECLEANGLRAGIHERHDGLTMVSSCSKEIHARLSRYVQGVKSTKRLTNAALSWDRATLLAMLGSYIDGDGHVAAAGRNRGQLRIRSSSPAMLRILSDVVRALGIPATVQWDSPPGPMVSPINGKVYESDGSGVVAVEAFYSPLIAQHSRKKLTRVTRAPRVKQHGNVFLACVTDVEDVPLNEDVFNLEVEDVHHYVANEVVVHNCNKDPAKASGHVKKAFWNDKMHRVELLIVVDNKLDPEWVDRVNDGDFPAVSMGCRIKYDVCSICGNRAPTRADYCDHAKFQMNQLMPDGKKAYVHNPSPNFFDISRVFRPADRTGYTLKKVAEAYDVRSSAELGEVADALAGKSAAIRKVSDIDKVIRGETAASSSLSESEQQLIKNFKNYAGEKISAAPGLPMDALCKHAAAEVFSTTHAMGIALKDREFIDFMTSKLAGSEIRLSDTMHEKIAALMPRVYDLFEASPSLCDEVLASGVLDISHEKISADLVEALTPYRVKRAYVGELLRRRLIPEGIGLRQDEAPRSDMLSYNDPLTGRTLQTTRGAAIDMRDSITDAHMRKAIGGSAMLLGGYKALKLAPGLRGLPGAVGATRGLGAAAMLGGGAALLGGRSGHDVMTNEGVAIPHMTEFAPKVGSENFAGLVVHLLESNNPGSYKHASFADSAVKALKNDGMVDGIRGLELNLETAADELGRLICS